MFPVRLLTLFSFPILLSCNALQTGRLVSPCTVEITLVDRPGAISRLMQTLGDAARCTNGPVYEGPAFYRLVSLQLEYNGDQHMLRKALAANPDILNLQISAP